MSGPSVELFADKRASHAVVRIGALVDLRVMARDPLVALVREQPALVQLWLIDEDMRAVQQISELRYVEAMPLEVGDDSGLLRGQASGRVKNAAPKPVGSSGYVEHQAHPLPDALGLRRTQINGTWWVLALHHQSRVCMWRAREHTRRPHSSACSDRAR